MNKKRITFPFLHKVLSIMRALVNPNKLRNILVIWIESGFCLLNIPYTDPLQIDKDLLAGLLSAIQHRSSDNIKEIRFKEHSVLFDLGDDLLNVMIMKTVQDYSPYREGLIRVSNAIQERFNKRAEWVKQIENGYIRPIKECALDVVSVFPLKVMDTKMTPLINHPREEISYNLRQFTLKLGVLESYIDNKRTIAEILKIIPLEVNEVIGLLSVMLEYNWVKLFRLPRSEDILFMRRKPSIQELKKMGYSVEIESLLIRFDGILSLEEISLRMDLTIDVLLFIVTKLVKNGILSFVENSK